MHMQTTQHGVYKSLDDSLLPCLAKKRHNFRSVLLAGRPTSMASISDGVPQATVKLLSLFMCNVKTQHIQLRKTLSATRNNNNCNIQKILKILQSHPIEFKKPTACNRNMCVTLLADWRVGARRVPASRLLPASRLMGAGAPLQGTLTCSGQWG